MNTLQFSKTSKAPKPIVCFNCFKALNANSNNGIDALVASISSVVYQGNNSMYIVFNTGKSIELDFNGGYTKYRRNGTVANQCSISTEMRLENGHIQLKIEDKTILMERLVAICHDIINDKMPTSYKDWVANVMDGSGSVLTASKLGIPVNYHPDNIEWCTRPENSVHGSMIIEMEKRTGHVYRYSANDRILRNIFLKNDNVELRNYCQNNLTKIR
ncbi:MAG: hypothetical protein K2L10_07315 [Ruminococcus sp.]|nr:hypothetical protein [Ruminococcus sp.]